MATIEGLADVLVPYPLSDSEVVEIARLRSVTKSAGLSLGDRSCLALARRLGLPVLTADRAWADLPRLGVTVRLLR